MILQDVFQKNHEDVESSANQPVLKSIHDTIGQGETIFDIFKRHGLNMKQLPAMREAAATMHRLGDVSVGQPYSITFDDKNDVDSFIYWIDEDSFLKIEKNLEGFQANRYWNPYEVRTKIISGTIRDNLVSAIGSSSDEVLIALKISDIFAWDIDFTSDLRLGDTFAIVVQALYLKNSFKKYGEILYAEFNNNGKRYPAYRFLYKGKFDYYNEEGTSLRKTFLKAPLSFKRISSTFSKKRLHPVLKVYRPHRGVDYAAPQGTPVSATANGVVSFAGHRGRYGKLVVIRHQNNYNTYYGHLSRIKKGIRKHARINQGDLIGYVGATGLATGPHLHYEIKHANKHVNPLTFKLTGTPIPTPLMGQFLDAKMEIDKILKAQSDEMSVPEKTYGFLDKKG